MAEDRNSMHRSCAERSKTRFTAVRFASRFVLQFTKNRATARVFGVGTVTA
jgi:hypothetical protein